MLKNNIQPIQILLVEDNSGDIELTQEAFQDAIIPNTIHVTRNGDEALDFLYKREFYKNVSRPDLILLDLNMPGKNGKEVLAIIKNDESLKDIPVLIFTSSEAENDVVKSYSLHANAYIVKPIMLPQFLEVVEDRKSVV